MKTMHKHAGLLRLTAMALCLCMTISMFAGISAPRIARAETGTPGAITPDTVGHVADTPTLSDYRTSLNLDNNSRNAGRIWTDKSVFANGVDSNPSGSGDWSWNGSTGTLTLKEGVDSEGNGYATPGSSYDEGVTFNIAQTSNADFLHVFSAIGSSQVVNTESILPLDVVMVLDVSGSMGNARLHDSKIYQSIKAMNDSIDKLMNLNPQNRVAVVLFSTYSAVLMPLAHYTPLTGARSDDVGPNINNYIRITECYMYSDQGPQASNYGNEDYYVYNFQALQSGGGYGSQLYTGASRSGDASTFGGDGNGEGGFIGSNTNIDSGMWRGLNILADQTDTTVDMNGTTVSRIPTFIFLGDGDPQCFMLGVGQALSNSGNENHRWWEPVPNSAQNTGLFDDPPIILSTLMRAAYMKAAVENKYTENLYNATKNPDASVDLNCFTVGITLGQTGHEGYGEESAKALLNPTEYFNGSNSASRNSRYVVQEAFTAWQSWAGGGTPQLNSIQPGDEGGSGHGSGVWYTQLSGSTKNGVTHAQVVENINYADKFFNADNADDIANAFENIMTQVTSDIFIPVSGTNDLGVSNALTFIDPVGKYMDVKDVDSVLLFGHKFPVVRAGIYNYNMNDEYMDAAEDAEQGDTFTRGWYKIEKDENGDQHLSLEGPPYPGAESAGDDSHIRVSLESMKNWFTENHPDDDNPFTSADKARAAGWEFIFDYDTITKFIPNMAEGGSAGDIKGDEDVANITYTAYRFEQDTLGAHDDGNHKMGNPSYGYKSNATSTDEDVQDWENYATNFSLTDIRIWVEDSGDWVDQAVVDSPSMISTEYDEALYISLPAAALPVMVAKIDMAPDGGLDSYDVNKVKPLRVIYTVGMEEDLLNDNAQIDLARVNRNYLNNNRKGTGEDSNSVYFYSNWYERTNTYSGYATSDYPYTYGDAMLSFSPDGTNRYYMFQKNLPLYKTGLTRDNYQFADLPFIIGVETTESKTLNIEKSDTVEWQTRAGSEYTGNAPLSNSLSVVTDPNEVGSNNWYYIIIDYYDRKDGLVHAAIPRLGSELGSKIEGAGTAEYLCWYQLGSGGEQVANYDLDADNAGKPAEEDNWVVATKVGGPRVGAMAQNVSNKAHNETNTSATAFLPTANVNTNASTEENNALVINVYLGNNGRLEVRDTQLLVTKQLTAHGEGGTVTAEQQSLPFHYQVYVDGFEGAHEAVMVQYSPYSNSWQRRIDTIDVNTDNNGYLLDASGGLAVFDADGNRRADVTVEQRTEGYVRTDGGDNNSLDGLYFVYLPPTKSASGADVDIGSTRVRRIFINGESGNVSELEDPENPGRLLQNAGRTLYVGEEDYYRVMNSQPGRNGLWFEDADLPGNPPAGSIAYWVTDAKLHNIVSGENTPYKNPLGGGRYNMPSQLTLALLQPSGSIWTSDLTGGTTYDLTITYLTKTLYFGYKEDEIDGEGERVALTEDDLKDTKLVAEETDLDGMARNTACFTLKHNEGLLIPGMDTATKYRVTEWLDSDTKDFSLQQLTHLEDHTFTQYRVGEGGNPFIIQSYGVVQDPNDSENWDRWHHNGNINESPCKEADETVNDEQRHYLYKDNKQVGTGNKEIDSATFGEIRGGSALPFYSASGQTSHVEEATHFVNYAPNVLKDETTPGEGEGVQVGSLIEYDIYWENTAVDISGAAAAGKVVVEDPLDPGVDFVSASYNPENDMDVMAISPIALEEEDYTITLEAQQDAEGKAETVEKTSTVTGEKGVVQYTDSDGQKQDQRLTIKYDKDTHTVTWEFNKAYAQQISKVHLVVRVNNDATKNYVYPAEGGEEGNDRPVSGTGGDNDTEVLNRASVKVEDHSKVYTEVIENPIGGPDKTETNVHHDNAEWGAEDGIDVPVTDEGEDANLKPKEGAANTVEGPTVRPGDTITYRIDWQNTRMELDSDIGSMVYKPSTVFIRDILDENVEFVRAYGNVGEDGEPVGTSVLAADPADPNAKLRKGDLDYSYKQITTENPAPEDTNIKNLVILYNQRPIRSRDYPTDITTYPNTSNANASTELHTVFFVIPDAAANSFGSLYIDVKVKDDAEIAGYVDNQAYVQVEDQSEQQTRIVENPVPTMDKEETDPGADQLVSVGDELAYKIAWRNETAGAANVVITDKLDPGVDFVSASYPYENSTGELTLTKDPDLLQQDGTYTVTGARSITYTDEDGKQVTMPRVQITYDPDKHTVTWTLAQRASRSSGVVNLTTKVNDKAVKEWNYGVVTEENPKGSWDSLLPDVGEGQDMEVLNRAGVKVGNQEEVLTKVVENPVPAKTEDDPGDGNLVGVGEEITYSIHWNNTKDQQTQVVIVDPLDEGVEFVSASFMKADGSEVLTLSDPTQHAEIPDYPADATPKIIGKATIDYLADGDANADAYGGIAVPARSAVWKFTADANQSGDVQLKVRVTEKAFEKWTYNDPKTGGYGGTATPDEKDHEVVDRAVVSFDNVPKVTNTVENPVPEKTEQDEAGELSPGDGNGVRVGEKVTYSVFWKNGLSAAADVIVTDQLDDGVTFVSASFTGEFKDSTGATVNRKVELSGKGETEDGEITIRYDEKTDTAPATVTWTLGQRPAGSEGYVVLVAEVNANAVKPWSYGDADTPVISGDDDYRIVNRAKIQIGDNSAYTNIPENPLREKKEITPGDGVGVRPGKEITYEITWKGDPSKPSYVVVTDKLDPGVDYVSASATPSIPESRISYSGEARTLSYTLSDGTPVTEDIPKHAVVWEIGQVEAGANGKVTLTVRVKGSGEPEKDYDYGETDPWRPDDMTGGSGTDNEVINRAKVTVDNTPRFTNKVSNPFGGPDKTETKVDRGPTYDDNGDQDIDVSEGDLHLRPNTDDTYVGPRVFPGDRITYEISWQNYKSEPAPIVIRDPLDPNVRFVSASFDWADTTDSAGTPYGSAPDGSAPSVSLTPDTTVAEKPDSKDSAETVTYTYTQDETNVQYNGSVISYKYTAASASASDSAEVTWHLGVQPEGSKGKVRLIVQVLSTATPVGHVDNHAFVQVGNDAEQQTRTLENPTPSWQKEEKPYDEENVDNLPYEDDQVQVGKPIHYEIEWYNNNDKPQVVTITDPLDKGVDFTRAWYGDANAPTVLLTAQDVEAGKLTTGPVAVNDNGVDFTVEIAYSDHTVTWTLGDAEEEANKGMPAFSGGYVELDVTVNEQAVKTWTYGVGSDGQPDDEKNGEGNGKDYGVVNRAKIQVGDVKNEGEVHYTPVVENPVPEKTELTPGPDIMVSVGETVTYNVHWENRYDKPARVIITDPLDDGADFLSASFGGVTLRQNQTVASGKDTDGDIFIAYDPLTRTVVWTLEDRPAGSSGDVALQITVNEKAYQTWTYEPDQDAGKAGEGDDFEIVNRARVQVGDRGAFTSEIENPVPDKQETTPGADQAVVVGQEIVYEIYWKNGHDEEADVLIEDTLDVGLTFKSASDGGTYDEGTRTVTWKLPKQPAKAQGHVMLTVKVNDRALQKGVVENTADMKIGDDPKARTRVIRNPTKPKDVPDIPMTGDESRPGLWAALALLCAAAMAGTVTLGKRKRDK